MSANDRQVGGDHYGLSEYQHWDWVADIQLAYHPATAAKYVDRWRSHPRGKENLHKAIHYLEKAQELELTGSMLHLRYASFWHFVVSRNHTLTDAAILWDIMEGCWLPARAKLRDLIEAS